MVWCIYGNFPLCFCRALFVSLSSPPTQPPLPPRSVQHLYHRHTASLSKMSPKKIHTTRSVTRKKALDCLNEMIEVVCPASVHKITMAQLDFKEEFEGYHVRLECGPITWTIQMWENCSFRRLTLFTRDAIAPGGNNGLTEDGLTRDSIWEGHQCDELVERHRLGRLRELWWENGMRQSNEQEGALLENVVSQIPPGAPGHQTYNPLPFRSFQFESSTESPEEDGSDTDSPWETDFDESEEPEDEAIDEGEDGSQE
ncbi:unnamed protein product [Tuber aestivum]|uniref:Uncharacterized protein n=1 Tax=Tuber aestivum TaxID=59557 RepID=A0A292Q3Z7_9PEZI|nr:unnamed protein product [Tuber aestivum]